MYCSYRCRQTRVSYKAFSTTSGDVKQEQARSSTVLRNKLCARERTVAERRDKVAFRAGISPAVSVQTPDSYRDVEPGTLQNAMKTDRRLPDAVQQVLTATRQKGSERTASLPRPLRL